MPTVEIHYHRPPDRLDVFTQQLVLDRPDCKVTLHSTPPPARPIRIGEVVVFEPGASVVWFVFPERWYDIGRFHLRDDSFTGYYANLITPPRLHGDIWIMYDLCLDLWLGAEGSYQILDQDEFDEAVDQRWIDRRTADRARLELEQLIEAVRAGQWPPAIAREIDLGTARALRERQGRIQDPAAGRGAEDRREPGSDGDNEGSD